MKKVIRIGDPTSHGGAVLSGSPLRIFYDKPVARVGDKVSCPQNGHVNCVIIEGDPSWLADGKPVALEGHKVSCGATLISTMPQVDRSSEESGATSIATVTTATAVLPLLAANLKQDPNHAFDEQFLIKGSTGNPLGGVLYTAKLPDGAIIHGETDSSGMTGRFSTPEASKIAIYLGHREDV